MATVALPRPRHAALPGARVLALSALALLTAAATVKHLHALSAPYWIDEGISVGISSHHLTAIPGVLRQDGSPPLYYLLLHLWIGVFGTGSTATHSLSAIFAVAAVPAAYWALAPITRAGGVTAAAVLALDPYVGLYADETRMYSLVLLLSVLVAGAFLRAFVLRRRRAPIVLAVLLALVLYAHAWGAFLALMAGLCWLGLVAVGPDRRGLLRAGAIAFGGALLLFAPWVPTLLYQAKHTGAPWSHHPRLTSLEIAFRRMWSGQRAEFVLLGLAAVGLAVGLWRDGSRTRRTAFALFGMWAGTLLTAWAYSRYGSPAWALRYLVIVIGPLSLLVGLGMARLPVVGPFSVVAVLLVGWFLWYGRPTERELNNKSNVAAAAAELRPRLRPGTVVFSTQPEQVPNLYHYLPAGLSYMTPLGPVPDVGVFDWRDALTRLRAARYRNVLEPTIGRLHHGQRLLIVQPRFSHPDSPWTVRIKHVARQWGRQVRTDPRLRRITTVHPHHGSSRSSVTETLYQRT